MLFNFSFNRACKAASVAALIIVGAFFAYPTQKASAQIPDSSLSLIADLVDEFASYGINCSSNIVEVQSMGLAEFNSGITDCAVTLLTLPNVPGQVVVNPVNVPVRFAFNVPGFNASLSRNQACGIISGTITQWNQVGGPNLPITFVYRSDSSSTTTILNNFTQNFCGFSVPPFRVGIGVVGSSGVINTVRSTVGSIAYIDRPTAIDANLPVAALDTNIVGPIYFVFRSSYNDQNTAANIQALCLRITSNYARNLALLLGYEVPSRNSSACNAI